VGGDRVTAELLVVPLQLLEELALELVVVEFKGPQILDLLAPEVAGALFLGVTALPLRVIELVGAPLTLSLEERSEVAPDVRRERFELTALGLELGLEGQRGLGLGVRALLDGVLVLDRTGAAAIADALNLVLDERAAVD
jgi:hypothetical protein